MNLKTRGIILGSTMPHFSKDVFGYKIEEEEEMSIPRSFNRQLSETIIFEQYDRHSIGDWQIELRSANHGSENRAVSLV